MLDTLSHPSTVPTMDSTLFQELLPPQPKPPCRTEFGKAGLTVSLIAQYDARVVALAVNDCSRDTSLVNPQENYDIVDGAPREGHRLLDIPTMESSGLGFRLAASLRKPVGECFCGPTHVCATSIRLALCISVSAASISPHCCHQPG